MLSLFHPALATKFRECPIIATNASFAVQVTGANGLSTNKAIALAIGPAIVNANTMPSGVVGLSYSQTLVATSGVAPYTWTIISGGLPAGLTLSTDGLISGIPSMATNVAFTAQVAENGGTFSAKSFSLSILSPSPQLAHALDRSNAVVTTYGSQLWFSQTSVTYDGLDAAKSGAITHNQDSSLETTAQGPGDVTFWWKVSSESAYDILSFYIDGVRQTRQISGTVDWEFKTYALSNGSHTLKWVYSKDGSDSLGSDCGWVDLLTLPTPPPPTLTVRWTNGCPVLNVGALANSPLVLYSSSNLVDWSAVSTSTVPVSGMITIYASDYTNKVTEFYRAALMP